MIYFFILPLWALAILFGIALLFFPKLRFLAFHVIFGTSFAVILSAVGLFASLVIFARLSGEVTNWHAWQRLGEVGSYVGGGLGILFLLGGFALGAVLGGLLGIVLAWWINRKLGWSHRALMQWIAIRIEALSTKVASR